VRGQHRFGACHHTSLEVLDGGKVVERPVEEEMPRVLLVRATEAMECGTCERNMSSRLSEERLWKVESRWFAIVSLVMNSSGSNPNGVAVGLCWTLLARGGQKRV
jgi:hypothetical protein